MRWLRRMLWVLGGIAFLVAALTVYALSTLRATTAPLSRHARAFPEVHPELAMVLARHADRLEELDPVAQWEPASTLTPVRKWLAEETHADAAREAERTAYLIGPRAFDDSTALEFATLIRSAEAVRAAGYGATELGELALAAQERRLVAHYSVPALAMRGGAPNWRAVLSGRAIQTPKLLTQGRRGLTGVPIVAAAPLDPLYPLAVSALDSAEGLGTALATLEALPGWTQRQKRSVAFTLGLLHWWSPARDGAAFFAGLRDPNPPGTSEDLRVCALAGGTAGLNLILRANEAPEDGSVDRFVEAWRQAIREPWVDVGVEQMRDIAAESDDFYLYARIPAQDGYLGDVAEWAAAHEPAERFYAVSFLGQGGYVGYLAWKIPEEIREIARVMPTADRGMNGSFVWAYVKVVQHYEALRAECWLPAMRSAFAMDHLGEEHIGQTFGARGAGDWRVLEPEFRAHIAALASRTGPELEGAWPLLSRGRGPVCPKPLKERGDERVEDPEFLRAVDGEVRAAWPGATPAYRQAVVATHLPRLQREGLDLAPWRVHGREIAPLLSGLAESPERQALLSEFAP